MSMNLPESFPGIGARPGGSAASPNAATVRRPWGLSARITFIMGGMLTLLVAASIALVNRALLQGFEEAELSIVGQNQALAAEALQRLPLRLNLAVADWATRDDADEFVRQPNKEFPDDHLTASSFQTLGIHLALFLDTADHLVWGATVDPDTGALTAADAVMADLAANEGALLRALRETAEAGGLVQSPAGVLYLAVHPIRPSDGSGPAAGLLIFGQRPDSGWEAQAAAILRRGNARLRVHQPALGPLPPPAQQAVARARASGEMLVTDSDDQNLHAYVVHRDVLGKAAVVMEIIMPRRIMAYGRTLAWILAAVLAGVQIAGMIVLWLLIQKFVGRPVRQLTAYVRALDIADPATHHAPLRGDDELSALATDFEVLARRQHADEAQLRRLATALEQMAECVVMMNAKGLIVYVNAAYEASIGHRREELLGFVPNHGPVETEQGRARRREMLRMISVEKRAWHGVLESCKPDGGLRYNETTVSPLLSTTGEIDGYVTVMRDVTGQRELESQLARAQKLEAIGQLAAGIAHEINTPVQYVGDNIRFVRDAFAEMDTLLGQLQGLAVSTPALAGALAGADLGFLREEVPRALDQSADGCQRIATIVKAMKEFSHPGQEKAPVDLNRAIQSTITVASNEWKYVAEVRTEFDAALPAVTCLPGEFNQVILNMLVNAAHAIGDVVGAGASGKGTITVSTRAVGEFAEIRISDTGGGITPEVRAKIFDPFFTTKAVGRGTGQGLAIAHDVIVNKHGGSIALESEPGKGATFIVRIPLLPPAGAQPAVQAA